MNTNLPQYLRSEAELLSPFLPSHPQLSIIHMYSEQNPDAFQEDFIRNGGQGNCVFKNKIRNFFTQ